VAFYYSIFLYLPIIKQGASAAANEHIQNYHTPEKRENSTNRTVKLNTCTAAEQSQSICGSSSYLLTTLEEQLVHLKDQV
jgi:hypothetical protein